MRSFWRKDIHNMLANASDNGVKGAAAFDASETHLGIRIPHSDEHVWCKWHRWQAYPDLTPLARPACSMDDSIRRTTAQPAPHLEGYHLGVLVLAHRKVQEQEAVQVHRWLPECPAFASLLGSQPGRSRKARPLTPPGSSLCEGVPWPLPFGLSLQNAVSKQQPAAACSCLDRRSRRTSTVT